MLDSVAVQIQNGVLPKPKAVLFDLDGTLLDSAPDLALAMNRVLEKRCYPTVDPAVLRKMAGAGARGLIGLSLGLGPEHPDYTEIAEDFFRHYLELDNKHSDAFSGVVDMLSALERESIPWGIVTNKATRFTKPVLRTKAFLAPAQTVVCGDTTPFSKPHPEPLLEAARRMNIAPKFAWYVGDDKRDMEAARAAGMVSVAACWGYLGEHAVETWGADFQIHQALDLLGLWGTN